MEKSKIAQDAASGHSSEIDRLLPTRDLKGTSLPYSFPPIVRRANMMLDTWPALHIVLGELAAFFRDNIKRVTVMGMMLSAVASANDVDGPNATWNAHNIIALRINHVPLDSLLLQYFGRQLTPQEDH